MHTQRSAETRYFYRDDAETIAKTVILQAMHRLEIPANALVEVITSKPHPDFIGGRRLISSAIFDNPRRFALWAVKEGYVPDEARALVLRYARA
jgi:hypothetical protein